MADRVIKQSDRKQISTDSNVVCFYNLFIVIAQESLTGNFKRFILGRQLRENHVNTGHKGDLRLCHT